ncbi:MAG: hypothetical protein HYU66_16885 [Armatimonadetes bacterium]|nr:hypothetical protein [Armatimonadota bacterium]
MSIFQRVRDRVWQTRLEDTAACETVGRIRQELSRAATALAQRLPGQPPDLEPDPAGVPSLAVELEALLVCATRFREYCETAALPTETLAPEPEPEPQPEPTPEPEPEPEPVVAAELPSGLPADAPALAGDLLAVADPRGDAAEYQERLKNLLGLPTALLRVAETGGLEDLVRQSHVALDLALHGRQSADVLAAAFGGLISVEPAAWAELAGWWEKLQRHAVAELEGIELRRMPVRAGSPFWPGSVEDSGEAPEPTANRDWHGRVAAVRPGNGGYEWRGEALCVTRAQRYEYVEPGSAGRAGDSG